MDVPSFSIYLLDRSFDGARYDPPIPPNILGSSAYHPLFQLSAVNLSTALKKNWLPSNPPQGKVAVPSWPNISPIVVDTSRILMNSPTATSVQVEPRTNGWNQSLTSIIATTGEISEFFVLTFYLM